MKTNKFILIFLLVFPFSSVFSQNHEEKILKKVNFTVPSRGEKVFDLVIPEGTKNIKVKIMDQTQMLSIKLLGPTNVVLCKNSTWSNMSNWRKPLECSASVVNNDRQKPGIWKVKVIGAVHKSKESQIKTVSGVLIVYITGTFVKNKSENSEKKSEVKEFSFNVAPRGEKNFKINVPNGAKQVKVEISNHTEMLKVELLGPTNVVLCKNSTWSNMSNWRKPLECSASVVNNDRQKPGIWKVKVIGVVQNSKVDKIKSVSGKLNVTISFN